VGKGIETEIGRVAEKAAGGELKSGHPSMPM
jgi:hypothetical protein